MRLILSWWAWLPMLCAGLIAAHPLPDPPYTFQSWQGEDGLPQNSVTSIAQTPDGYLWMGTFNGLVRFDGLTFKVFDSGNTPALPSSRIVNLISTDQGDILVRSEFGHLSLVDGHGISSYREADNLSSAWTRFDSSGKFWLEDNNGMLYRSSPTGAVFTANLRALEMGRTVAVVVDGLDVWLALKTGNLKIQNQVVTSFPDWNEFGPVVAMCTSSRGGIWVAFAKTGVGRWQNGKWVVPPTPYSPAPTYIWNICEDRTGNLWVCTEANGALRLAPDGSWSQVNSENGLSHNSVRVVFEDTQQIIWIGTDGGGLNRLKPRSIHMIGPDQGIPTRFALGMVEDMQGRMWVNVSQNGTFRENSEGKFERFDLSPHLHENGVEWSIVNNPKGELLTYGLEGQLLWVNPKTDSYRTAPNIPRRMYVRTLLEDPDGTAWIGETQGLFRCREGVYEDIGTKHGLLNLDIRAFLRSSPDELLIGSNGSGLLRWDGNRLEAFSLSHGLSDARVWSLFRDGKSRIWVGTFGGGLHLLANGKFYKASSFPFAVITSMLEDDSRNLWIGTMKGIVRVSAEELAQSAIAGTPVNYRTFDKADGMASSECSGGFEPAAWKRANGELWFSTIKGVAAIDPDKVFTSTLPPAPKIESVLLNGVPFAITNDTVSVAAGITRIEIIYTGLDYAAPQSVRFKYQMGGLDSRWTDVGTSRSANFAQLKPGDYTFRLLAGNQDGNWNDQPAELRLEVLPKIWQTWWFIITITLALGSGVFAAIRHTLKRRFQAQVEELERQHALERERSRISHDMHDALGANLSQIVLMSALPVNTVPPHEKLVEQMRRVSSLAGEVIQSVDEIVWAINPRNDSLDNFADYVCQYCSGALENAHINFRWESPAELPSIPLSSETRHHLFLALKEVINNAIKHSRATEMKVQLEYIAETLKITLRDNGVGFVRNCPSRTGGGVGLVSIRERLKKCHGLVILETTPGAGTTVILQAPVDRVDF